MRKQWIPGPFLRFFEWAWVRGYWQSCIEMEHYSVVYFECISSLACYSTELLLTVGLIHALVTHEDLRHVLYEVHTCMKHLPDAILRSFTRPSTISCD